MAAFFLLFFFLLFFRGGGAEATQYFCVSPFEVDRVKGLMSNLYQSHSLPGSRRKPAIQYKPHDKQDLWTAFR